MKKIIRTEPPWAGFALIVFFLFTVTVEAGCGIESSNPPQNETGAEAEEISAPILRAPADGSIVNTTNPVFDWDDVPLATAFQIQISSTNDFSTLEIDREVSTSSFTASDFILSRGVHFLRVRAKDSSGRIEPMEHGFFLHGGKRPKQRAARCSDYLSCSRYDHIQRRLHRLCRVNDGWKQSFRMSLEIRRYGHL